MKSALLALGLILSLSSAAYSKGRVIVLYSTQEMASFQARLDSIKEGLDRTADDLSEIRRLNNELGKGIQDINVSTKIFSYQVDLASAKSSLIDGSFAHLDWTASKLEDNLVEMIGDLDEIEKYEHLDEVLVRYLDDITIGYLKAEIAGVKQDLQNVLDDEGRLVSVTEWYLTRLQEAERAVDPTLAKATALSHRLGQLSRAIHR